MLGPRMEGGLQAILDKAGRVSVRFAREMVAFRGRARIVDLVYFGLLISLTGFLLKLPLQALPWDSSWFANAAVDIVLFVPCLALFCRRLHDQGLSDWWAVALLPSLPVNLYQSYRAVFAVVHQEWLFQPDPLGGWRLLLIPVGLVVVALALGPGTRGPNRYGPDPRAGRAAAPA